MLCRQPRFPVVTETSSECRITSVDRLPKRPKQTICHRTPDRVAPKTISTFRQFSKRGNVRLTPIRLFPNTLLKKYRSPLQEPRASGAKLEIVEHFPFVLSASKHSESFFSNLPGFDLSFLLLSYLHPSSSICPFTFYFPPIPPVADLWPATITSFSDPRSRHFSAARSRLFVLVDG